MKKATDTVMAINEIRLVGNIIPPQWYKTITFENGKPHLNAIVILSEIVYWYRPRMVRDEATGQVTGYERRFKADLLQRSYESFSDQFGLTKRQVKDAIVRLEELKIIERVFRTIEVDGVKLSNVLYIDISPEALQRHTYDDRTSDPMTIERHTNTETTDTESNSSFADAKGTAASHNDKQLHLPVIEEELPSTENLAKERKRKQPVNNSLSEMDEPKPPTETQLYFGTICEVLGWDYQTLSKSSQGQVAQTMGILKKAGYDREDVQRWFNDIWMRDWLWEKFGKYPNVKQLREGIGQIRQQTPQAPPTQAMQVNYTMESLYGDD